MTAIAWAIIFLAIMMVDGIYVTKFSMGYPGASVAGFLAGWSLIACAVCTVLELRRSRRPEDGK